MTPLNYCFTIAIPKSFVQWPSLNCYLFMTILELTLYFHDPLKLICQWSSLVRYSFIDPPKILLSQWFFQWLNYIPTWPYLLPMPYMCYDEWMFDFGSVNMLKWLVIMILVLNTSPDVHKYDSKKNNTAALIILERLINILV